MFVRILLAVLLGGIASFAQSSIPMTDTRRMSLRDCIDLALSKNLDVQIQQLNVDIAGNYLSGAYGPYVPVLNFTARHDFLSEPQMFDPKKLTPDQAYDVDTDRITPGLAGRLPMGLSYNLGTSFSEEIFDTAIRRTNITEFSSRLGLTVQQHLLKDFWIDPYRQNLLIRRKEFNMSQEALRFQVMRTILGVEVAYYDLAAAREQVRVQEKALELRQQLVAETKRRVEVGDVPELESEQAETQLQNTLTALASARERMVFQQNALKTLFTDNFKDWALVDLQAADILLALREPVNLQESFTKAVTLRPDLEEARVAVQRSAVVVKFQKNQLFPSLDLIGRYGGFGYQPSFNEALNDATTFRHEDYYYGVVMSVPLSNVTEKNNYRASKAARAIAELQLKKAEQAILVQVADEANRVNSKLSQLDSTRKARVYAESALTAEEKKLKNGLTTTFVVLQLQETLTSAKTLELQALAEYNKAKAQLAFAEGTTLERHSLVVETR